MYKSCHIKPIQIKQTPDLISQAWLRRILCLFICVFLSSQGPTLGMVRKNGHIWDAYKMAVMGWVRGEFMAWGWKTKYRNCMKLSKIAIWLQRYRLHTVAKGKRTQCGTDCFMSPVFIILVHHASSPASIHLFPHTFTIFHPETIFTPIPVGSWNQKDVKTPGNPAIELTFNGDQVSLQVSHWISWNEPKVFKIKVFER